ncbi:MAG: hypothetical protein V4631_20305 [Pseudomonadota bacterium]
MTLRPSPSSQRGQALTEFIVVALALVPLFLLLPLIAKYQDMAHAAQMASRYVAFESTTRNDGMGSNAFKSETQLADEVRRRFFSNSDAAIKTGDVAGDFRGSQNLFWRTPKGASLITSFADDAVLSFGTARGATHASGFSAASDGRPFNTIPVNVRDELDLKANGVYTANISVKVADIESAEDSFTRSYDALRTIGLNINRHTSLSNDSWTASGPQQVEDRIDKTLLFPGRLLRPIRPVVGVAVALVEMPQCFPSICNPNTIGPQFGGLDFWRDEVPSDRLR